MICSQCDIGYCNRCNRKGCDCICHKHYANYICEACESEHNNGETNE